MPKYARRDNLRMKAIRPFMRDLALSSGSSSEIAVTDAKNPSASTPAPQPPNRVIKPTEAQLAQLPNHRVPSKIAASKNERKKRAIRFAREVGLSL